MNGIGGMGVDAKYFAKTGPTAATFSRFCSGNRQASVGRIFLVKFRVGEKARRRQKSVQENFTVTCGGMF